MPKKCPQCQGVHPDTLEFCPVDGARLVVPPPPQARAPRDNGRRFPSTLMGMPGAESARVPGMSAGPDAPSAPAAEDAATRFYDASVLLSRLEPPEAAAAPADLPDLPDLPGAGGTTLRDVFGKGPLPTDAAVARIAAVADVVAKAGHAVGTLTPAHVRYAGADAGGQPGLTEAPDLDALYVATYRAPELDQGPATAAADVYALGCLLFEAVTGKAPIRGKTPAEVQKRHATAAAPAVRQIRVDCDLPPALELEIQRSLRKRPGDRHPGAAAFATAIRATMKDDDRSTMALGGEEAAFLKSLLAGEDAPVRAGHTAPAPAVSRAAPQRPAPSIGPAASAPSGPRPAAGPAGRVAPPPPAPGARSAQAPETQAQSQAVAARHAPTEAIQPRSNRGLLIGVGAAAAVVVLGGGAAFLLLQPGPPPPAAPAPAEPAARDAPPAPVQVAEETPPPAPEAPDVQAAPAEDIQVAVEEPDAGEDTAAAVAVRKPVTGKKPPRPVAASEPEKPQPKPVPKPKDGPITF